MNIDVIHNVYSNNCSLLYVGRFFAENYLSINLKVHFPRWRVGHSGKLPVMNSSILMDYLKLSSWKSELENKHAEYIFCNGNFSKDERGKI